MPERRSGRQLPALVFLHGDGQSAASVLAHLSPWAERHHFVLIAPEATAKGWRVPDRAERTTADALARRALASSSSVREDLESIERRAMLGT